jgi:RHS repeat-associated protein
MTGTNSYWYVDDALGSTRLVYKGSTKVFSVTTYKPFGIAYGASGTEKFTYAGEMMDSPSGLFYLSARYYDPNVGRFVSMDPKLGKLSVPQTLDRYAYCANNPINRVDPTGEFWNILIGAVAGAIIGGVIAAVTGGDVLAGVAGGLVGGAIAGLTCGASLMVTGAVYGATSSFTSTMIETRGDIGASLTSAVIGGALGGITAGIASKAAPALSKIGSSFATKAGNLLGKIGNKFGSKMTSGIMGPVPGKGAFGLKTIFKHDFLPDGSLKFGYPAPEISLGNFMRLTENPSFYQPSSSFFSKEALINAVKWGSGLFEGSSLLKAAFDQMEKQSDVPTFTY